MQRTLTTVYDADSNVVTSIDPFGFATAYGYDALNRRVSVTNPDGGIATTVYDPVNNVVNHQPARAQDDVRLRRAQPEDADDRRPRRHRHPEF